MELKASTLPAPKALRKPETAVPGASGTTPSVTSCGAVRHDEMRHLVVAVASAHRLTSRVEIEDGTPPVVNSPAAARCAARAVEALLGSQALADFATPNLGGEAFGFYLERLPSARGRELSTPSARKQRPIPLRGDHDAVGAYARI